MSEWGFLTNHALVMVYIAKNPESTIRQIARAINVTEWTVHKIVGELENHGYIDRQRVGRKNSYRVHANLTLRHEILRDLDVGTLLEALGWEGEQKKRRNKKALQVAR